MSDAWWHFSFLIHSIRLQYLRHVEDPYGPRLISFDPSYRSNPYVLDAGMADVERWPELGMPTSPAPSDDESGAPGHGRPSGFPGATSLKYTTTILGPSRTGALGLRTNGKRTSVADVSRLSLRRSVSLPRHPNGRSGKEGEPDTTPTLPASASPRTTAVTENGEEHDLTSGSAPTDSQATLGASSAPQLNVPIPFIPKFKGAAEMEARRQLRMRNRIPPGGFAARPQLSAPATLNPERSLSSSSSSSPSVSDVEEEQGVLADEDDEDEFDDDVADDMDDDDEFDP